MGRPLITNIRVVYTYQRNALRCRLGQEKQAYEVQSAFVDKTGIGKKPDPFFTFMLHCAAYPVRYPKGPAISQ